MPNVITKKGVPLPLHANGSTTFGADSDIAVTVAKEFGVAGKHFTIFPESGRYFLKDLKTGLGTKVNSQPATTAQLAHGDRIQAGKLELIFSDPDSEQPATQPISTQSEEDEEEDEDLEEDLEAATKEGRKPFSFRLSSKKKNKLVLPARPKKKPKPKPKPARELKKTRIPAKVNQDRQASLGPLTALTRWRKKTKDELVLPVRAKKPKPKPKPARELKKTRIPAKVDVNRQAGRRLLAAWAHWRKKTKEIETKIGASTDQTSVSRSSLEAPPKQKQTKKRTNRKAAPQIEVVENLTAKQNERSSSQKHESAPAPAPVSPVSPDPVPQVAARSTKPPQFHPESSQTPIPPVATVSVASSKAAESPPTLADPVWPVLTAQPSAALTEPTTDPAASLSKPKQKQKQPKPKKPKRPPLTAIVRRQGDRVRRSVSTCLKIVPLTCQLARSGVARLTKFVSPIFKFPAAIIQWGKRGAAGLQRNLRSLVRRLQRAGATVFSRSKDSLLRNSVCLAKGICTIGIGLGSGLLRKFSELKASIRARVAAPDRSKKPEAVFGKVQAKRKREWLKFRLPSFPAWRRVMLTGTGITAFVGLLGAGVFWVSQNQYILQGLSASDSKETVEPALISRAPAEPEPDVAAKVFEKKPRTAYPVTEKAELAGTWVTVETHNRTNNKRKNRLFNPGAVFRFEEWGSVKMLTAPGRKDGQPLSKLETIGLQADFKTSYEVMMNGLVLFHTREGDLIFFASRKGDGLSLALLDPNSREPLVERFCLPHKLVGKGTIRQN